MKSARKARLAESIGLEKWFWTGSLYPGYDKHPGRTYAKTVRLYRVDTLHNENFGYSTHIEMRSLKRLRMLKEVYRYDIVGIV